MDLVSTCHFVCLSVRTFISLFEKLIRLLDIVLIRLFLLFCLNPLHFYLSFNSKINVTLHTTNYDNILYRIKLILSILEAKASDTPPGCDITIKDLAHHECVMAAFPIHEFDELKKLTLKWLTLFTPPWDQPIGTPNRTYSCHYIVSLYNLIYSCHYILSLYNSIFISDLHLYQNNREIKFVGRVIFFKSYDPIFSILAPPFNRVDCTYVIPTCTLNRVHLVSNNLILLIHRSGQGLLWGTYWNLFLVLTALRHSFDASGFPWTDYIYW